MTTATARALEIRVTLTSGASCEFVQDDPARVRELLAEFQPARLYDAPQLMFGGDHSLSVFPAAGVERVDLIGDGLPEWRFLGGATQVREVSEGEFHEVYHPGLYGAARVGAAVEPGTPQHGFTEYWTVSGQHLFWRIDMVSQPLTPLDFKPYIHTLLEAGGLHARTAAGVAVLNPRHLVRMTFHPGPPTLPPGAWPAHRR